MSLLLLLMAWCLPSLYATFPPLFPCSLRWFSGARCEPHKHSSVQEKPFHCSFFRIRLNHCCRST